MQTVSSMFNTNGDFNLYFSIGFIISYLLFIIGVCLCTSKPKPFNVRWINLFLFYSILFFISAVLFSCATSMSGTPERNIKSDDLVVSLNVTADTIDGCRKEASDICRNSIISKQILITNIYYNNFVVDLDNDVKDIGFASSVMEMALNAAGALTGGTEAKILSTIAGSIVGANTAFNSTILYGKLTGSLIQQMNANRADVLSTIYDKMSQPYSLYSLDSALVDLDNLYNAGTLVTAINKISQSTSITANTAAVNLEQAINSSYKKTSSSIKIHSFIYNADRTINSKNLATLNTWLKTNNISERAATFITNSDMEQQRIKAIADLNIK